MAVRADAPTDALDTAALQLIADISRNVDEQVATTVRNNAEAARNPPPAPSSDLRSRVLASIDKVSKGLLERETEVGFSMLRDVCTELAFCVGRFSTMCMIAMQTI